MQQRQFARMQRLSAEGDARRGAAPVDRIADDRMPEMLKVHANLMRTAGVQLALDERRGRESFDHLVARSCFASAPRHRHARARPVVTADRLIDRALDTARLIRANAPFATWMTKEDRLHEIEEDDLTDAFYENDTIDLEQLVQEQLNSMMAEVDRRCGYR